MIKKITALILCFLFLSINCFAGFGYKIVNNSIVAVAAGCAGGTDGYIGRTDNSGDQAACTGTCTTNYLYFSKFVVETDTSQEDGSITKAHWNTSNNNLSTRIGIWNTSGVLVVGSAEQEGTDAAQDAFDVSVTSTCLAAGTYYEGIWVEGNAWAGIRASGYIAGEWTRVVEMATFGNMAGDPETQGSVLAANGEIFAWFDNTAGR